MKIRITEGIGFVGWLFLAWRMILFLPLGFGFIFLPYRSGFEFTNIFSRINPYFPVHNIFIFPWANFDGVNSLSISGNGYSLDGRYFPLFPSLINLLSRLFGDTAAFGPVQFFSGLVLSNVASFLAMIFLYKLIILDYPRKIARWVIVLLLAVPTSFFFAAVYSEGLFLLLLVLSFYFARHKKWLSAGFCGALLAVTRPVGILILPALLVECLIQKKNISFRKAISLLIIPIGLLSYILFNQFQWGSAFYFLQNQGELANGRSVAGLILFPQTIARYFKIFISVPISQYEWWIAFLELGAFTGTTYLLYKAWKLKIRLSYFVFAVLAFFVPASTGTFTGLPRYIIVLFPIYLVLAHLPEKVKYIYLIFSSALLFLLLMFFARGYYIA